MRLSTFLCTDQSFKAGFERVNYLRSSETGRAYPSVLAARQGIAHNHQANCSSLSVLPFRGGCEFWEDQSGAVWVAYNKAGHMLTLSQRHGLAAPSGTLNTTLENYIQLHRAAPSTTQQNMKTLNFRSFLADC